MSLIKTLVFHTYRQQFLVGKYVRRTLHSTFCLLDEKKTLYDDLGLDPSASSKEIKSAYLEMSKKYHPDVNPGDPEAANKFNSASAAYATLGQAKLRRMYDKGNLGRVTSVADRESATHTFDGSDFVEVSCAFLTLNYSDYVCNIFKLQGPSFFIGLIWRPYFLTFIFSKFLLLL